MAVVVNNEDNDGGKGMSRAKAQEEHYVPFVSAKLK